MKGDAGPPVDADQSGAVRFDLEAGPPALAGGSHGVGRARFDLPVDLGGDPSLFRRRAGPLV